MFRFVIKSGLFILFTFAFEIVGLSQQNGYSIGYKLEGKDTIYQIKIKHGGIITGWFTTLKRLIHMLL